MGPGSGDRRQARSRLQEFDEAKVAGVAGRAAAADGRGGQKGLDRAQEICSRFGWRSSSSLSCPALESAGVPDGLTTDTRWSA